MQFLPRIKQSTDAVVNITTGGGQGMALEERLSAAVRASPELCSLNMGSMNFGLYPMIDKYKSFQQSWEPQYLEASRDWIFRNRSEEHTSELQSLMRISYAVFCLKKKKNQKYTTTT